MSVALALSRHADRALPRLSAVAAPRAIGHPVTWIGGLIGELDRAFNRDSSRARGARRVSRRWRTCHRRGHRRLDCICRRSANCSDLPFGIFIVAVLASALIAQRSLYRHVADVAAALESRWISSAARAAVSHIVGRDTAALDAAGVARAAIESLAENFSDAVVAPVLWLAIAGLPGVAVYKAINTADSMIGHRTERHEAFGWAAARLDDLVNLPASRLAALLLIAAAALRKDPPRSRHGKRSGSTRRATARRMPAIRKPQWPARWACRLPARGSMAACASTMPSWAAAVGMRPPPISAARFRFTASPTRS